MPTLELLPPPLTAEGAAMIPTSLLLLDVMSHYDVCSGTCSYCQPKLAEIDARLPVRDPRLVNIKLEEQRKETEGV